MLNSATWQISTVIILIIMSAFFSASETALTALNKIRLRHLVNEDFKGAKLLSKLIENPSKLLGSILVGNNIVNIAVASLATTISINYFGNDSGPLIATLILTPVLLIFGEITPKSFAAENSEKFAFAVRNMIKITVAILSPIVAVLAIITNGIIRLLGGRGNSKNTLITEEEIITMVNVGHEEGTIEVEERQMIKNVFQFGDSVVEELMIPRTDIVAVSSESSYQEILGIFKKQHLSRLPVYEETIDKVIGIINIKDLILYDENKEDFKISKYIREPYFTFEFKSIAELFSEMRTERMPMAIVLDEYGGTAGLITTEDLVEEIVGDINDEYDEREEEIEMISEAEFLVDGSTRIDIINETLELSLESEDFDTIGGFVFGEFGRVPEFGEEIEFDELRFIIENVDKNRIEKLRIINFKKCDV